MPTQFESYTCALCGHSEQSLGAMKTHLAQKHDIGGPFGTPEEVGRGMWVWDKDGLVLIRGVAKYPET